MSPPGQEPSVAADDPPSAPGTPAEPAPGFQPEDSAATALARTHTISPQPEGGPALTDRLQTLERQLHASYQFFAQETAANRVPSQASEWLLDNFYVVQQATRQIREDMPKGFYSQLPKLAVAPLKGHPRVYAMARTMTGSDHGTLDLERVKRFVQDYQQTAPLTMGEIWALPTMLRMGLVERLVGTLNQIRDWNGPPGGDPSAAQTPSPTVPEESAVGDCIVSLRAVANQDWKAFFEDVSVVEEVLRRDPAKVYARMDFATRDRYRKAVEELARATGQDEAAIAQQSVQLAGDRPATSLGPVAQSRASHVGFYLVDSGRAELEQRVGYRPSKTRRLRRWMGKHPALVYLGSVALLTLAALAGVLWYAFNSGSSLFQLGWTALLYVFPALVVAVNLVNLGVNHSIPPRTLPRMEMRDGVPAGCATMVVIPALPSDLEEIRGLLRQLELHFLGNQGENVHFALLTDFADAPDEHMPGDDDLLDQLKLGINALNVKYGHNLHRPFHLLHRERQWNPAEECWMGWERKRGKLVELNWLIAGNRETSYAVHVGDSGILRTIRYVVTVDADTILPPDCVRRLVATLAHPLNQPVFDPGSERVAAGYTVLQPRIEITPTSSNQSLFARAFSGETGLDPYTRAVSDAYQDLFGEGIYVGKGIYDVDAFERSLSDRVRDNTLLSHDLFEGIHGRTGLVTDIILLEDYPPRYLAYARRMHRWVRGDWQLLQWLLPQVPRGGPGKRRNDLSIIDRWKIFHNLSRSLLSPALLALLVSGWLWLPGSPVVWTLLGLAPLSVPFLVTLVTGLIARARGATPRGVSLVPKARAARWLFALAFLPYEALLILDAIASTLVRLTITRKRLLQWTSSAHTIRLFGKETKLATLWSHMGGALVFALELALLVTLVRPVALPAAAPMFALWLSSMSIANRIGRPSLPRYAPMLADERRTLRSLARRTWLFFEHFVDPSDHWLPPDHFQENPRGLVAHRTSPTNLGLLLLSTLAAYDMGYIGVTDLLLRLSSTFDGMRGLERYRGHLLNWYNTRNLEPLPPRYVSTVDSGNLAGCLLTLKQGCLSLPHDSILRGQRWQGLIDALEILSDTVTGAQEVAAEDVLAPLLALIRDLCTRAAEAREDPEGQVELLATLNRDALPELERLLIALVESGSKGMDAQVLRDLRSWSERVRHHVVSAQDELDLLAPWLTRMRHPPALFSQAQLGEAVSDLWKELQAQLPDNPALHDVLGICDAGAALIAQMMRALADEAGPANQVHEAHTWCENLSGELDYAGTMAGGFLASCRDIGEQAEAYLQAMDFGFLYDNQRHVFHLGYNVESEKLDANHYDLLASEARLGSLWAIAKGDVPQSHWIHLARPIAQVDGTRALLSWNGSMFEYLMPTLLMRTYAGTLLDQTCRGVVRAQVLYGRRKGVPWGISEAGYYGFDAHMNYQYRGFGVPGLGLKRGLGDDLVVSPHASVMGLPFEPRAVLLNYAQLRESGMLGHYGLYESIDFTSSRLQLGRTSAIVQSYMAHHQGMILLALANFLHGETMRNRFHSDPRVQSSSLLLQERIPQQVPIQTPHPEEAGVPMPVQPRPSVRPWQVPVDSPLPNVHLLSNGRFSLLITSAGGGFSQWHGIDLTRWRPDTTLDNWGTWIYIQDVKTNDLWSAYYQPTGLTPDSQNVLFHAHKVEFQRRDHDISSKVEVTVAPTDDIEARRITLTNHSPTARRLRLLSYAEVVLAPQIDDQRHTAFSKLFVESEYVPELGALLFRRRPRTAEERPVYLAHLLVTDEAATTPISRETDRARFLGRGRTPRSPVALRDGARRLSGTTGATLDPVMVLGQEIELAPHATRRLAYVTLAAESREAALSLARRYQILQPIDQAFEQARSHSELELHRLGLTTRDLEHIQLLLSALLYPHAGLRADSPTLAANTKGQPGLWPYAISGDHPILLARVETQEETGLVGELLQAHAYWRSRQIKIDLVIINEREAGYDQELQGQLRRLIARTGGDAWLNRPGGIFVLRRDQIGQADQVLLETTARAILHGDKGSLAEQVQDQPARRIRLPRFVPTLPSLEDEEPTTPVSRPPELLFSNGLGGFNKDGREYVTYLEPGQWTPLPWVNVIANDRFGFLVSEAGSSCTWAENSGENRLTPWRNDPVADTPGEALYLRDEETGALWSPTPLPTRYPAPYLVRHGAGYSVFEHHSHGLKQRLLLFALPDAPVKVAQLRLENVWSRTRRITATYYAEWVLGPLQTSMQQYVVPEFDAASHALLARNTYNIDFGDRVAFLAATREPHGLATDRAELLGRMGGVDHPSALTRVGLSGTVRPGSDPCAALQVLLWLDPGETKEVTFLLGQGSDRQNALDLVRRYRDIGNVQLARQEVTDRWDRLLGTVTVRTPDPAFDLLLNRWLLYQALSCRVWGRTAFYQSSGAFGFRDQLQDVMALVHAAPDLVRAHILDAARHQFEEGDVLHWWHPPLGRGVRTRCSDDLLWLPFVTAFYVTTTGDESILAEKIPFLTGKALEKEEKERYGQFETAVEPHTLFEHCRRALERGTTAGSHGLPLMGSHDWNDGMSRVGIEGKGESVWLGWFLYATLTSFAPVCEATGKQALAEGYREQAGSLREVLEATAWDGEWYLRAYYDDGTPLGSAHSDECQIDSIAQSWAVLSGAADPARAGRAMAAVAERLVRHEDRLIRLFDPPFDKTSHDPGYIKGYLPGIRENGGQYTHAALWAVWAFAELGQGDRAEALFRLLNPIYHSDTSAKLNRYRVEPYVVAADVYSVPPHVGRGGWTWYTGSASWMYRVGLEAILGLKRSASRLQFSPCIPRSWPGYEITFRHGDTLYHIKVENPEGVNQGVKRVKLDGKKQPQGDIPLVSDGLRHEVQVLMG